MATFFTVAAFWRCSQRTESSGFVPHPRNYAVTELGSLHLPIPRLSSGISHVSSVRLLINNSGFLSADDCSSFGQVMYDHPTRNFATLGPL